MKQTRIMHHKPEAGNSFALSVANLGVVARCSPSVPVSEIQRMYRDFPLLDEVHLSLDIRLNGQERSSAILDTGTRFREGQLEFCAPGYQGYISIQQGTGLLNLSSRDPAADIDYCIRVAYALLSFQAGGVMLHAAGIVRQGLAHLFFGHSGAGKTTVSNLSPDSLVLNDDLVILLPEDKGWRAYGTPFWNPTQCKPTPQSAQIIGLYSLEQASHVALEPLEDSKALAELVANVPIIPLDPVRNAALLACLNHLIQDMPVKKLYFKPDPSFWSMICK